MLEVRDLSVSYGKHRALDGAALRVGRGEIVVILGANGAGKSTLLKAISGICEGAVSGSVTLQGTELAGLPPHRIVDEGIALVPEGRGVFGDLTVAENLSLGGYPDRARDETAAIRERVFSLFPRLAERTGQQVRTMSGGEQQMVAIGRAMMSNPALLTLDEPSLGLSPLLSKELFQNLKAVRDSGIGILLVEQNAKASLAIADRAYLLENARIVHEGRAADLRSDPAVQKAYLGGAAASTAAPARPATAAPAAPRPARGPSPADIAAAALTGFAGRQPKKPVSEPESRAEPAPRAAPLPPPPLPPAPLTPAPRPAPQPARSAADALLNRSVSDLVAQASATSRSRTGQGPRPAPKPRQPVAPAPPPSPSLALPDMGDSRDRLQSILDEIEQAAVRARAWRPDQSDR